MNILVSVLMPVYNSQKYLKESIESILNQTYKNIEFIIVNDGSTDKSLDIIKSFSDKRIKIIDRKENRGIIFSLNEGIEKCSGKYIVRMDSDDISLNQRIEKQVLYMEKNRNIDASGTGIRIIGSRKILKLPIDYNELKVKSLFSTPLFHPTVIIKSEILKKVKYPLNCEGYEDYMLWKMLISKGYIISNLSEKLVYYRINNNGITQNFQKIKEKIWSMYPLYEKNLKEIYEEELTQEMIELFLILNNTNLISSDKKLNNKELKEKMYKLICQIAEKTSNNKIDKKLLVKYLSIRWCVFNLKLKKVSFDKYFVKGICYLILEKIK